MSGFRHAAHDEEQCADEQAEIAASTEALRRGELPSSAKRRIDTLKELRNLAFTTGFGVGDFALARRYDVRPVAQVAGTCLVRAVRQDDVRITRELRRPTQAINRARWGALEHVRAEARRLGAHLVTDVRIAATPYEWEANLIGFEATGTAVRWADLPAMPRPCLTTLSVGALAELRRAGYVPIGLVSVSTIFFAKSVNRKPVNRELVGVSRGVYKARRIVMDAIGDQGRELEASGVVDLTFQYEHEREGTAKRIGVRLTIHAVGTAIKELDGAGDELSIAPVLSL